MASVAVLTEARCTHGNKQMTMEPQLGFAMGVLAAAPLPYREVALTLEQTIEFATAGKGESAPKPMRETARMHCARLFTSRNRGSASD
jgi:hypothetical protein